MRSPQPTAAIEEADGFSSAVASHEQFLGQPSPGKHRLNEIDRVLVQGDVQLRAAGLRGYIQQSQVWVAGRLNVDEMRSAIGRLRDRFPVLTSRLKCTGPRASWCWEFQSAPTASRELELIHLDNADDSQLATHAERIFNQEIDPTRQDPVTFYLVRGATSDLFLLQWHHVLMDGKAGDFLLRELDREFVEEVGELASPRATAQIHEYLRSFSWRRQLSGFGRFVKNHPTRGKTVSMFPTAQEHFDRQATDMRLLIRSFTVEQTAEFMARTRHVCGFPNATPALLASAFRAVRELTPQAVTSRSVFYTLIPINLRAPNAADPLFCNYQTYVRARVEATQLDDRDKLVKVLQTQMRNQLREGADVGFLRGFDLMSRLPQWVVHKSQKRVLRLTSFLFGYHGSAAELDSFCGRPVDRLIAGIPMVAAPPGLGFAANQAVDRLNLIVSHLPAAVPPTLADAFVGYVADDLLR